MFFWNSIAFLMIYLMLASWFLVPLHFLKPVWTSGISRFMYWWCLAWRILSVTLLVCEMSAILGTTKNFLKYIRIQSAVHFHHCPKLENKWCRQLFFLNWKTKIFLTKSSCMVLHCVRLFVNRRPVAHQASLSMGFSRQEYWRGLPSTPPGDLRNSSIKLASPALQADSLPLS